MSVENEPIGPKLKQYGVWVEEQGDEGGFWALYDSISAAVSEHSSAPVYRLSARLVGRFRRAQVLIRIRRRKRRAKAGAR